MRLFLEVAFPAAAAVHRDLTEGMAVCPTDLAQVTDGLDTAIYRLDPGLLRFRCLSARDGLVDSLSSSRSWRTLLTARTRGLAVT